jgi:hypothetical protein
MARRGGDAKICGSFATSQGDVVSLSMVVLLQTRHDRRGSSGGTGLRQLQ